MERRWKVLTVVSVAVFMVSLDLFIVNVAFPDISRDFGGADVASVSWVLNAYAIVVAALMVPAGRMADRLGRRKVFLTGLLAFVVGSALCAAAPSVETLVGARVIQALGAALLLPTSLALLLPEFPVAERSKAIGIWAAVGGVAAAAGPPIGGLLVQASWRLVFLVNVPVGLVAFVVAARLLRESRDETQERPDLLGAALLTVAVGVLALGLVKAPAWGWGDPRILGSLAGAGLGITAFWKRSHTHSSPVVDPAMVEVRSFAVAGLASLLFSAAFAAMLLGNVLFMTGVWGDSILRAGFSLSAGPVIAAAFASQAGRFSARYPQRTLATAGIALFALGSAWWAWRVGPTPNYAAEMLPGLLITGVGVGLTLPSLASAAAASLPPARFATGSAVFTMSRQLGFVLGVSILVAVLGTVDVADPVTSYDRGWLFMVVAAGLGALAALGIGTLQPQASGERSESRLTTPVPLADPAR
jgi:EmrB/QacA subfamily drug resistance transporter